MLNVKHFIISRKMLSHLCFDDSNLSQKSCGGGNKRLENKNTRTTC